MKMTDKKFTDKEIIKALEYCNADRNECDKCVLKQKCESNPFYSPVAECSLDLINRQRAENEMLKKRISEQKHALFEQQEHMAELQQKLETKCDDCDNIRLSRPEYWKAIKTAKAEAYKEFADRLKKKCRYATYCGNFVNMFSIDHILKELVRKNERDFV